MDEFALGILKGKIVFDLPKSEADKLNMKGYQNIINRNPIVGAVGGGGGPAAGGDDEGKERKANKGFLDLMGKSPMGKGMADITKLLGPIGAIVTFVTASGGLRELLGAFFDLIGVVSDLIFVALFPVIRPFLDNLVKLIKNIASHPGGIIAALFDPQTFTLIALLFIDALLKATDQLIILATRIVTGVATALRDPTTNSDITDTFASIIESALNIVGHSLSFAGAVLGLVGAIFDGITNMLNGSKGEALASALGPKIGVAFQAGIGTIKQGLIDLFTGAKQFVLAFAGFLVEVITTDIFWRTMINLAVAMGKAMWEASKDSIQNPYSDDWVAKNAPKSNSGPKINWGWPW